jgi:hypothetical protein
MDYDSWLMQGLDEYWDNEEDLEPDEIKARHEDYLASQMKTEEIVWGKST